tara:strand:- start:1058 stop:1237 length:180 start_codon:yes stop_codon:yes gene_type:complete
MDIKYYYGMMPTLEDIPKGADIYKEGGLKCHGISHMERMLDQEAKTNLKGQEDASEKDG